MVQRCNHFPELGVKCARLEGVNTSVRRYLAINGAQKHLIIRPGAYSHAKFHDNCVKNNGFFMQVPNTVEWNTTKPLKFTFVWNNFVIHLEDIMILGPD